MSHLHLEESLNIALEAAKYGADVLLEHWGKLSNIREKSAAGDLVTEADQRSEEVILEYLKRKTPQHRILSEETGLHEVEGAEFLWAVDPLDGTTNYAHQVPVVAVSIALLHKGVPIVGVVHNPFIRETFTAIKGYGAYLNDQRLYVSQSSKLSRCLLATGFAYDRCETPDNNYAEFCFLTSQTQGVRRMGSAAIDLSYVAAGRYDGFWERGLKVWDIAAGVLLVQEAGGKVSSYENTEVILDTGRLLATNGLIHDRLSILLQQVHGWGRPIVF